MARTEKVLGQIVRSLRTARGLSQMELADRAGIHHNYVSRVERGDANVTIDVASRIAEALGQSLAQLFSQIDVAPAKEAAAAQIIPPRIKPHWFKPDVAFPQGLSGAQLAAALDEALARVHLINAHLLQTGNSPLFRYTQQSTYSNVVSNMIIRSIDVGSSSFVHNDDTRYPDLINPKLSARHRDYGLEVKATHQVGKGAEGHNPEAGWVLVAAYRCDDDGGTELVHVQLAYLEESDWSILERKATSKRTRTSSTNARGLSRLRDGTVYLDRDAVDTSRWRIRPARLNVFDE